MNTVRLPTFFLVLAMAVPAMAAALDDKPCEDAIRDKLVAPTQATVLKRQSTPGSLDLCMEARTRGGGFGRVFGSCLRGGNGRPPYATVYVLPDLVIPMCEKMH